MVSRFHVQGPARTFIMWRNSDNHRIYFPNIVCHGDLVNSSLGCLSSVWVTQINVGPINIQCIPLLYDYWKYTYVSMTHKEEHQCNHYK